MCADSFSSVLAIKGAPQVLKAYYNALQPEEEVSVGRGSYSLKLGKDKLVVKVRADDAVAFRAVLTSLLGLIAIVEKSIHA